ncbi:MULTISPECIES: phage head closure protein [Cupriavidus]|jgi:SPP1 family predicted phage head-tail adaptor|uniref:phage head closure protein n=1 Tax=Cupriavidus TaxID=106589 RepID=UPI0005797E56|nr:MULTISPECIES: phage head closure protein [Cupriavidus]KWR80346.1 phage head-tail joining protein [Cupriavidus sp. SHE]QWC87708.1 phage head closure protein [Cupriavidus metallidurans]
MQLGKYNRRILLERPGEDRKPSGQPMHGWIEVARPWAWIRGKSGREVITSGVELASSQFSMRIRYRTDVQQTWRVVYRGEPYEIKSVLPDEAGREYVDLVVRLDTKRGPP